MTRQVHINNMVAHLWANKSQESARSNNGNFYFEGDTIYSYGSHFPIARHVEVWPDRFVLFTTEIYSATTSQHCAIVRSACSHLRTFDVPLISANDLDDHNYNLKSYIERIEKALLTASRARKYGESYLEQAAQLNQECLEYCKCFGLAVPELVRNFDTAELLKQAKERAKRERERIKKENAEKIEQWRNGIYVFLPRSLDIMLRVAKDGNTIETSHGAHFPTSHGIKAFEKIAECRDNSIGYKRNGHSIHLGSFIVDEIDAKGNVKAGCHFVKWPEIERLAQELGIFSPEKPER